MQRLELTGTTDNIAYYKCDVSNWEEVASVQKQICEEVYSTSTKCLAY